MTDTLAAIAALTGALIGQDAVLADVAGARRALMRQAIAEGHSMTAIGESIGISRQRVAQLLAENGRGEQ